MNGKPGNALCAYCCCMKVVCATLPLAYGSLLRKRERERTIRNLLPRRKLNAVSILQLFYIRARLHRREINLRIRLRALILKRNSRSGKFARKTRFSHLSAASRDARGEPAACCALANPSNETIRESAERCMQIMKYSYYVWRRERDAPR